MGLRCVSRDFLLVYAKGVEIVDMPVLEPPFTKESVQQAFSREGIAVRVTKEVIGRELREVLRIKRADQRSENAQRATLEQAERAATDRGSIDPSLQEKGTILLRKQEIDEELRQVKVQIDDAKTQRVTSGRYIPREEYQRLLRRQETLKQDSQACQVRLTRLRETRRLGQPGPSPNRLDRETYNARLLYYLGRIVEETSGREASESLFRAAKERVQGAEAPVDPPVPQQTLVSVRRSV